MEGADAVVAGGTLGAAALGAVVLVLAAVVTYPAVDADAGVAAHSVGAGGAVLADGRPQRALVHVLRRPGGRRGETWTPRKVQRRLRLPERGNLAACVREIQYLAYLYCLLRLLYLLLECYVRNKSPKSFKTYLLLTLFHPSNQILYIRNAAVSMRYRIRSKHLQPND